MKTLLLFAVSLIFSINIKAQEAKPSVPIKWEYKIHRQSSELRYKSGVKRMEKELTQLGIQGWELVSVVHQNYREPHEQHNQITCYFKRPVQTKVEQSKQKPLKPSKKNVE